MIFCNVKPTTPSRRQLIQINKKHLAKSPTLKNKVIGKSKVTGKNHSGKITVFHKGGGAKKRHRLIDFDRNHNSTGIVCSLEYDPNRSAFICSVFEPFLNRFSYILAPKNLKVGDVIKSGIEIKPSLGSSLPMSEIPVGTYVYNVSPKTSKGGQLSRSAGTFSVIKEKTESSVLIELSSGEQRFLSPSCFASVGEVSNNAHLLAQLGKAGRSRWLNKRPTVRGVAMNPVDHPHGGGEGKKSGKSLSPWGKPNRRGKTGRFRNNLILKNYK